ncbi:MAG: hypothetical protein QNJ46_24380 [Leptolyngbyaceae cyanobacterium MO_188.B28]|nr:hypothetical protein [Leptolyngbyaceae cyanobacterium MO_188.B28]
MSPPSAWLESLVELAASCMEAHSAMGTVGYRYTEEDDLTEVIVYPTPVELVGGEEDGTLVVSGFTLDIQTLTSAFEQVIAIYWYSRSLGPYDLSGANVSIEGLYQGHSVWMQILADPPEDEQPGMKLDATQYCSDK